MELKCIVIDDDDFAIESMVGYIEKLPGLSVFKTYNNPLEALQHIDSNDQIDFIFLDIEMPGISGIELAQTLRSKTRFLVFTTSHAGYALEAWGLNASQYLLKPFNFSKFALAVNKLLEDAGSKPSSGKAPKRLQFIRADQKHYYHNINPEDITYIEAAKNYVIIYTATEQFVTHMGISHVQTALDSDYFIRVSKSYIIAKNAIKKIEGNSIRLKNDKVIQLGNTYKSAFLAFIQEHRF